VSTRWYENRDFRLMSRFISETIQGMTIIIVEDEYKLICELSNGTVSNDLE